jgi:hypothetical protein
MIKASKTIQQKGNTIMALPDDHPPQGAAIVRGAAGDLYLVAENHKPLKLSEETEDKINNVLTKAEHDVTNAVRDIQGVDFSCTRLVHIVLPEVLP